MKPFAIAAVGLLAAAAGVPAVVGVMAQNRLTEQAGVISGNGALTVTVDEYRRGWLDSTARLEVELSQRYRDRIAQLTAGRDGSAPPPELAEILASTLALTVDMSHGPILSAGGVRTGLASSVIRLDPETEGLEAMLPKLGMPYVFELRTRSGFSGVTEFEFHMPPTMRGSFQFSGLTAEGLHDPAGSRIAGEIRMDHIQTGAGPATVSARNLSLSGDLHLFTPYVLEGPVTMTLDRLVIDGAQSAGASRLEASELAFTARSTVNDAGERLDMDATYRAGSVTADDSSFENTSLRVAARNLDAGALAAYGRIGQDLVFPMALFLPELQDVLYDLLAAAPSLDLGPLSMELDGEVLEAAIRIRTDTEMLPPRGAFSLVDSALWTRVLTLEAELDVGRALAEDLAARALAYQMRNAAGEDGEPLGPEEIEARAQAQGPSVLLLLAAQGMIEQSENAYRSRVVFEKGILDVNGREIPLGPRL